MKTKLISAGLLAFAGFLNAQNASYNIDNIPIGGGQNCAFGVNALNGSTSGAHITAIGYRALPSNSSGSSNSAIGSWALYSNDIGNENSALGDQVLYYNTSGSYNTATGFQSMVNNITGSHNTASGYFSLKNNSSGNYNSAFGRNALTINTSGNFNTALGYYANASANNLSNSTAIGAYARVTTSNAIQLGDSNVAQIFGGTGTTATFISGGLQITGGSPGSGKVLTSDASGVATWQTPSGGGGGWSLTGNAGTVDGTNFIGTTDNVPFNIRVNNQRAGRIDHLLYNAFFGYQAGNSNTTGIGNTALGDSALYFNTTGSGNSANGYLSLTYNTTGLENSSSGYGALYKNTIGNANSAFGVAALFYNTIGSDNTAVGLSALNDNTSGDGNTGNGGIALSNNTTGSYNTALGYFSLLTNITGSNNTALGSYADVSTGTFTNAASIGYGAIVNANDKVFIGNTVSGIVIGGHVGWSNLSDGRFKENIKEDVPGLSFITKLRPVTYTLNNKKLDEHIMQSMPDSIKMFHMQKPETYAQAATKIQTGFIAQEVEQTAKELGYNFDGVNAPKNPTDNYSIAYSQFIMPLVKAVQEQQQMIEDLKQQLANLQTSKSPAIAGKSATGINTINNTGQNFSMDQNIPNPFTHETLINFTLPKQINNAYMAVYDLAGKQIATFVLNERGSSFLSITSEKLAAGIYMYSIIADGIILDSKRMVVADK